MATIKDIRLAEFGLDVLARREDDSGVKGTTKAPTIEISFRYEGLPLGEPKFAVVEEQGDEMEEGEVEEQGEEMEEGEVSAGEQVEMEEGEVETGVAEDTPAEGEPTTPNHEDVLLTPYLDKEDAMDASLEEEAVASEPDSVFESTDPPEFPLAKAFSDKPDSGFEVRLRFRKTLKKRGPSGWFWPVACGLLAGLDSYQLTIKKRETETQMDWDFDQWRERQGRYPWTFPHATFAVMLPVPGEDFNRWRMQSCVG